jgi:hypothetical protein
MSHTNVLCHLETGDLLVTSFGDRDIAIIHTENVALFLRDASFSKPIITPRSLITTKSDTRSLGAVIDTGEFGKGSPSTTDIQERLAFLESDSFTDNGKLVILELFKSLLLVDIRYNTRCVDHAWAKEPPVEIITAVVMVSNLLLICKVEIRKVRKF